MSVVAGTPAWMRVGEIAVGLSAEGVSTALRQRSGGVGSGELGSQLLGHRLDLALSESTHAEAMAANVNSETSPPPPSVRTSVSEARAAAAQKYRANPFADWYRGQNGLAAQAENPLAAAGGTPITWFDAEQPAAEAIQNLFADGGISGINVVYVPAGA